MPPKTRRTKSSKALKENESENVVKSKTKKDTVNNTKPLRKALADKTNSASDDNTSILIENVTKSSKSVAKFQNECCENNNLRPRRIKKLPNRYNENVISPSLSNNKENSSATTNIRKTAKVKTPEAKEEPVSVITPSKLPDCDLDNSLLKNRPKRICRLPSKFDDHSISPNKFIPVQPINASTPLTDKTKTVIKETAKRSKIPHTKTKPKSIFQKPLQSSKTVSTQNTIRNYLSKTPSDTNNNAKQTKLNLKTSARKSTATKTTTGILRKDISDNVKEKTLKRNSSKVDVYEFTYDPNDEPPPPKKKKKKVVRKPAKPKTFTVKTNYDKNLAKALATLKHTVATKSSPPKIMNEKPPIKTNTMLSDVGNSNRNKNLNINESINERNYNSVRVEDIALDMQVEDDNIDYSPVNSPSQPKTSGTENIAKPPEHKHKDISFFDELPVANSSMNSSRHPLSSPWRVEFNNLPIKWQVNTYVKPNMTPAYESSFMNFNDSKKNHIYTNIVSEANVSLPQIVDSPNLKQTSIISFIKEVVEKSANKKKKIKSTPVKANSLFEDTNMSIVTENSPKKQMKTTNNSITPTKNVLIENNSTNTSSGTDSVNVHNNDQNDKSSDNNTYFGFDDTEDQENVSPKKKNKARSLRARTRGILQELNSHRGPMRAVIPVIAKSKPISNTEGLKKIFDEVKSASEPPVFPEASVNINNEVTVTEPTVPEILDNEDSQSVHLFEDIDVVHHQKPIRKSYGKPKRVAFRKNTMDSDTSQLSGADQASSDEDLDDLSFKLPTEKPKKIVKKKKTKKQMLSKKEEKEVEAWAAGFNSMCEDIDEFDLVVE